MKYMDEALAWVRVVLESGCLQWIVHVPGEPFTDEEVRECAMVFEGGRQWEDDWGSYSRPKGTLVPADAECDDYADHKALVEAPADEPRIDVCYNGNEETWLARLVVPGAPSVFCHGPCPDRLVTFLGRKVK